MPDRHSTRALALGSRIHFLEEEEQTVAAPADFSHALLADRVVRLRYRDGAGTETWRDVEPLGSIGRDGAWYLVAWCRTRDGVRAFRSDRMLALEITDERPLRRSLRASDLAIEYGRLRSAVDWD